MINVIIQIGLIYEKLRIINLFSPEIKINRALSNHLGLDKP